MIWSFGNLWPFDKRDALFKAACTEAGYPDVITRDDLMNGVDFEMISVPLDVAHKATQILRMAIGIPLLCYSCWARSETECPHDYRPG